MRLLNRCVSFTVTEYFLIIIIHLVLYAVRLPKKTTADNRLRYSFYLTVVGCLWHLIHSVIVNIVACLPTHRRWWYYLKRLLTDSADPMVACIFPKKTRYKLGIRTRKRKKRGQGKNANDRVAWVERDPCHGPFVCGAHLPASPHLDIYSIYTETMLSTPRGNVRFL